VTLGAGETIETLSARYGVPASAIRSANGLGASARIGSGQKLTIPVYSAAAAAAPAAVAAPAVAAPVLAAPAAAVPAVVAAPRLPKAAEQVVAVARPAAAVPQVAAPALPRAVGAVQQKVAAAPANVTPRLPAAVQPAAKKVVAATPKVAVPVPPRPVVAATPRAVPPAPAQRVVQAAPRQAAAVPPKAVRPETVQRTPAGVAAAPKRDTAVKPQRPARPAPAEEDDDEDEEDAAPAPKKTAEAKAKPRTSAQAPAGVDQTTTSGLQERPDRQAAPERPHVAPKAEAAEAAADGKPDFRWPARGRVISAYGSRSGNGDGIAISVPEGTPVKASEGGTVAYAGEELKGYGKLVLIKHDNGYVTAYAHNGELNVKRGESVKRGQMIAKSGSTGNVTAPQLHFEIRKGNQPVDPTKFLDN
jgi:murein DD-endopeptidase MepM/ murein hydrolase activator NlpD